MTTRKPRAYLPNAIGFFEDGRKILDDLVEKFTKMGFEIYEPFRECDKRPGERYFTVNNELMDKSDCLIAYLDGPLDVDSGVAEEIGRCYERIPIFALRTDFRIAGEHGATPINQQLLDAIIASRGSLSRSKKEWFDAIIEWREEFIRNQPSYF